MWDDRSATNARAAGGSEMSDITNADKLAALHNQKLLRKGTSLADLADVFDPPRAGRFAPQAGKVSELVAPIWAGQDNVTEPPLGYDINAQEPTGTPAEVEASIRQLEARSAALPAEGAPAHETSAVSLSADDRSAGASSLRRRL